MFTKCYLNSEYMYSRLINLGQKVLGRNYTRAPVPWQSLLPLWSRRLYTQQWDNDKVTLTTTEILADLIPQADQSAVHAHLLEWLAVRTTHTISLELLMVSRNVFAAPVKLLIDQRRWLLLDESWWTITGEAYTINKASCMGNICQHSWVGLVHILPVWFSLTKTRTKTKKWWKRKRN